MVTIGNREKAVSYTLSKDIKLKNNMFYIEPPKIACTSSKDAEYIQKQINALVSELSHLLLK